MRRNVERESKLPAFSVNVAELEVLWNRLLKLFEDSDSDRYYSRLSVTLPSEELVFDNIEELRQYSELKGKTSNFSLTLSEYSSSRRISIRSGYILSSHALVRVSGDNEAWCAGAIEVVLSFLQNHKIWYSWLVSAPLGWYLFLLTWVPNIIFALLPKDIKINKLFVAAWLAITITLAIIYIGRAKLLPSSIIRFSDEESFIKKYGVELSLIIAVISAVLTIIGWFVSVK
jgi:hypothetical protein